jgi:hypothetical protein
MGARFTVVGLGEVLMEPRFQHLKDQLLADCQVPPAAFRGAIRRLETFAQPFGFSLEDVRRIVREHQPKD